jgi:hypothetical protein
MEIMNHECRMQVLGTALLLGIASGLMTGCIDFSKAWQGAQQIGIGVEGSSADVAMDDNGNGLAVWVQNDGEHSSMANRYTLAEGWEQAESISTDEAGHFHDPQIAMDANGNGLAVGRDDARSNIMAHLYTPAGSWELAEFLNTNGAMSADQAQITIDDNGNGLAVWRDSTNSNIWANRYTPAGGWELAELIDAGDSKYVLSPQIAMDANGNGLAVWQEGDHDDSDSLWANHYTPAGGWEQAELIEISNSVYVLSPQIAMDAAGNGMVVWLQYDGEIYSILANRYTPAGGWEPAEQIQTNHSEVLYGAQIAMDAAGNGLAVWSQYVEGRSRIGANRYTQQGGWEEARLIESLDTGQAHYPQIAMDVNGNGLVVWLQVHDLHSSSSIWANHYTPEGGWELAQLIDDGDTTPREYPQIVMDAHGNGLAVWSQYADDRWTIWSNAFTLSCESICREFDLHSCFGSIPDRVTN